MLRIFGGLSKEHQKPLLSKVLRRWSRRWIWRSRFSWVVMASWCLRISLPKVGRFPRSLISEISASNLALVRPLVISFWIVSREHPSFQPPSTKSKQGSSDGPAALKDDGEPRGDDWAESGPGHFCNWMISAWRLSMRRVWLCWISSRDFCWPTAKDSSFVSLEACVDWSCTSVAKEDSMRPRRPSIELLMVVWMSCSISRFSTGSCRAFLWGMMGSLLQRELFGWKRLVEEIPLPDGFPWWGCARWIFLEPITLEP